MRTLALIAGLAVAASSLDAAAPSARMLRVLEAPHTDPSEIVRALLADPTPDTETKAFVYLKPQDAAQGFYTQLDSERAMAHPWQRPNWFVAFRFRDRRFGTDVPPGPRGDIEMAAPPGEDIGVGAYANAQAFAFQDEGRPGLTVKGPCAGEGGNFEIIELHRNAVGHIDRLGATFASEGCRGLVVYRKGSEDRTGLVDDPTPLVPRPDEPVPTLASVIAGFAEEDPRLTDLEIPENPAQPTAAFYAHGEDYVGHGKRHLVVGSGEELKLNMKWEPKLRVFDLRYDSRDPDTNKRLIWDWQMSSGVHEELDTGVYPYAGRLPFQAVGFPGLAIFGAGKGCSTLAGYFRVLEIKRLPDGTFERFAADFVQHCESWGPPLKGFVVYRHGGGKVQE